VKRVILEALPTGDEYSLEGYAFHHLAHVLRVRSGERLTLLDGAGKARTAAVAQVEKRRILLTVGDAVHPGPEPPLRICIGQAPGRGDRFDDALQHAVEVGASGVFPLMTDRTTVKWSPGDIGRLERHRRIARGACEQCGRAKLAAVGEPVTLRAMLQASEGFRVRALLHPHGKSVRTVVEAIGRVPAGHGRLTLPPTRDDPWELLLMVGPEGGFSEEEVSMAQDMEVPLVSLGPLVARTETAAVVAVSQVMALLDWETAVPTPLE
jgi:16S rRNA (uracil1498-N3)-methyltransferase